MPCEPSRARSRKGRNVATKTRENVRAVKAAEIYELPSGFPVHDKEHVVKPACERTEGQWTCVTHRLTFANNLQADLHESPELDDSVHVVGWWCFEHGLEEPR